MTLLEQRLTILYYTFLHISSEAYEPRRLFLDNLDRQKCGLNNDNWAFLIPYAIMIAVEGIPLFYLELAVGQRLRKGAIGSWNQISPYLVGIGIASAMVSFNVALYYNTIMAWCLIYLVQSFMNPLPWSTCPMETVGNVTIVNEECQRSGPTTYFWYRETLQIAPSIDSPSVINWKLAVALLFAWLMVYLCVIKGIKSSGKVVYVTATFPYLVLIIFFFRGVTLKGFDKGLEHLFVPEWKRLLDPVVWLDAATQIFYSFGLAFGCLIAFASYNPVRSNFVKEAIIVSIADFLTSIFTAVVVFSILGYKATMAYEDCLDKQGVPTNITTLGKPVPIAAQNSTCNFKSFIEDSAVGTGMAFIVFTEAINQFPVAQLWSILFFLMLVTLGIDSLFGTLEGAITSINDLMLFPGVRKEIICSTVCLVSYFIALCFATSTGPYVFDLFDSYCANIPLLLIALSECLVISYKYGLQRFSDDIELMIGVRPNYFWMFCWRFAGPIAMLVIFVASLIEMFNKGSVYGVWDANLGLTVTKQLPWWCQLIAAVLILSSLIFIPVMAFVKYFRLIEWKEEVPAFFPAETLAEERNIVPHESTFIERHLFGFES
ncbi:hypothetical protein ACJMK2_009939 [Sinanodonta woodiana]|uniref:Uncharacterized protein n=1 Tax=Sinanodonta woodiana TaxID=1069815 RepID=A0ABD3VFC8_SINWO